jgi:PAS domain S-box-containing protein
VTVEPLAIQWSDAIGEGSALAEILDHVAHAIFIKDRGFRYVLLNDACCKLIGQTRTVLLGKSDYEVFPKGEADFFRLKDAEMFTTGQRIQIDEEWLTDAQGVRHVLATTKVPLRSERGEVTHLVGIIHDITRIKEAEDALREVNEELERRVEERGQKLAEAQDELVRKERLAVLGQLAGGVAHQIRNPLGAISNAAYVLKRTVASAPDAMHAVEIIHEEVWRANRIISDLLDYARVRRAVTRDVSLAPLLDAIVEAQVVPANIKVKSAIIDLPDALVDPDQVRGALTNVVQNAFDAMPEGGTLSVNGRVEGEMIVVEIEDTGTGISDQVRGRLFEPLVSTKPLGLGLGLTTARALVENQGGSLTLDETSAKTRFVFRVPIGRS